MLVLLILARICLEKITLLAISYWALRVVELGLPNDQTGSAGMWLCMWEIPWANRATGRHSDRVIRHFQFWWLGKDVKVRLIPSYLFELGSLGGKVVIVVTKIILATVAAGLSTRQHDCFRGLSSISVRAMIRYFLYFNHIKLSSTLINT